MGHRITSQPSTALCFCRGASHLHPKLYLEMQKMQEQGVGGKEHSYLMLLTWFSPTLVASPSSQV